MRRAAATSRRLSPRRTPTPSSATRRREDAAADRDARVAASAFDGVTDAIEALRDAAARAALDERIREYDAALRAEKDRLRDLELELAGAPEAARRPHRHRNCAGRRA